MEKASILLRVSTKGEDQNESLQEPESINYVKDNNWDLFKIYHEQGSAFKNEFEDREVFQQVITEAIENNVKHLVVWNMDRYSRLEPDKVLKFTKKLKLIHSIKVHSVHGDNWSSVVETVSKIDELGFVGEALSEFLDKLLQGFEHQRAHNESKVKSERVKLAVRKKNDITLSYKGNKWGCPGIDYVVSRKILWAYLSRDPPLSIRALEKMNFIYETKDRKTKIVKKSTIANLIKNFKEFSVSKNTPLENLDLFINEIKNS
jgi:DNA invertase Pin-like site-specific DNA recombinase